MTNHEEHIHWGLVEEDPLEWDADSTEGEDVPEQELPEFDPALFGTVPGVEIIRT